MTVETKANVGNEVYYLSRIKRVSCPVCEGTGIIFLGEPAKLNFESPEKFEESMQEEFAKSMSDMISGEMKKYKCPNCNGRGTVKATGQARYQVHKGNVYKIATTSVGGETTITYTIKKDDGNTIQRVQNEVWTTSEEAVEQCDFLNLERRLVPLECIQISKSFANTIPHNEKLMKRLDEWRSEKKFQTEIYIDDSYKLFDGYTAYLMYRMLGIFDVPVVIWPKKVQFDPAAEGMF